MILAILATAFAAQARLSSLDRWRANPEAYFVRGVPVMTSPDAYYFLRLAQAKRDGTFIAHADDPLRHYERLQRPRETSEYLPSDAPADWERQRTPKRMPLLAETVAALAPLAGGVERGALYLTPLLASLFMIPLCLYAWRLGEPAAGLLAALTGAFAPTYFSRTDVGYVDTDCLNLLFPWLASLLIFSIGREARTTRVLVTSALLGVVLYLHFRWYEKAAISAMYWGVLTLWLVMQRRGLRTVAVSVLVCIVFSHPVQLMQSLASAANLLTRYWSAGNAPDGASVVDILFPNVMETVVEQRGPKGFAAVGETLGPASLAVCSLAGLVFLLLRRWRDCIPLLPVAIMGAFTFVSGTRFSMYLAPLAGLGLGYLITELSRMTARRLTAKEPSRRSGMTGSATATFVMDHVVVIAVFVLWLQPSLTRATPKSVPSLPAADMLAVHRAAVRMPTGARVWTWWDRGFAYPHVVGWTVYHDGAAQYTPQTHVIAYSLATDDQGALHAAMARVDRIGNRGIAALAAQTRNREALLAALSAPAEQSSTDHEQFVVFSRDMLRSVAAQRRVAGLPVTTTDGVPATFRPLPCSAFRENRLECGTDSVDLTSGRFKSGKTIRRLDIVDDGVVVRRTEYPNASELVLELVIGPDRNINVFVLPDEVYRSNLNRMFVLGEYDRSLFEEVYREVPRLRVFRRRHGESPRM